MRLCPVPGPGRGAGAQLRRVRGGGVRGPGRSLPRHLDLAALRHLRGRAKQDRQVQVVDETNELYIVRANTALY